MYFWGTMSGSLLSSARCYRVKLVSLCCFSLIAEAYCLAVSFSSFIFFSNSFSFLLFFSSSDSLNSLRTSLIFFLMKSRALLRQTSLCLKRIDWIEVLISYLRWLSCSWVKLSAFILKLSRILSNSRFKAFSNYYIISSFTGKLDSKAAFNFRLYRSFICSISVCITSSSLKSV